MTEPKPTRFISVAALAKKTGLSTQQIRRAVLAGIIVHDGGFGCAGRNLKIMLFIESAALKSARKIKRRHDEAMRRLAENRARLEAKRRGGPGMTVSRAEEISELEKALIERQRRKDATASWATAELRVRPRFGIEEAKL